MIVHLYTVCHNEEFMIPYFLRHYDSFVTRIFVFDNQSTDLSRELLSINQKVEIRQFDTKNEYREDILTRLRNQAWKNSRGKADLVIVCDMDEFLFHPNIPEFLNNFKQASYSIAIPQGYEMISQTVPQGEGQIYDEIQQGVRSFQFDKMVLFDPSQLIEINYFPGAHMALPEGQVRYHKGDSNLKLLHFRYLSEAFIMEKHAIRRQRYSEHNRLKNWGFHYLFDEQKLKEIYRANLAKSEKII